MCGVRGAGNLTTLNVKSKGRARAVLGDPEAQYPWWCGDPPLSDMSRPTCGSARMMHVG